MSETDQIKIARITAKQAIIVALITSISGLAGALLQKFAFDDSQDRTNTTIQNEIRFRGIEFNSEEIKRYRVIMEVDGVPYSYPGRSVWKEVGPKIPEQSFPLYSGVSEYSISIEVIAEKSDGSFISAISEQGKSVIEDSGLVNFRIVEREGSGISRGGNSFATVQVELIKNTFYQE